MRPGRLLSLRAVTLAAIAAGGAGAILALANIGTPVRAPLVILFLAVAPAAAIAPPLGGFDRLARLILVSTGAIVINFLVAEVMLAAGVWSPRGSVAAVAVFSAACAASRRAPVKRLVSRVTAAVRGIALPTPGREPEPGPASACGVHWPVSRGGGPQPGPAPDAAATGEGGSAAADDF